MLIMDNNKSFKLTVIKMNGLPANMYVNTGGYAHKIADELVLKFPDTDVTVEDFRISLSREEFLNLLQELDTKYERERD